MAYQFITANETCMFMTLCTGEGLLACFHGLICHVTGRYYNDPDAKDREVAYCRRVDSAPTIEINEEGISWVVLGNTNFAANLPTATCSDSEDGSTIDDPVINYAAVDTSQPGNYDAAGLTVETSRKVALHPLNLLYIVPPVPHWTAEVTYTCTDSAGQSVTAIKVITVKSDCSSPTVANYNTTIGSYCLEGLSMQYGATCTSGAQCTRPTTQEGPRSVRSPRKPAIS